MMMSKSAVRVICIVAAVLLVLGIFLPILLTRASAAEIVPNTGVEGIPPWVVTVGIAAAVILIAAIAAPIIKKKIDKNNKNTDKKGDDEL